MRDQTVTVEKWLSMEATLWDMVLEVFWVPVGQKISSRCIANFISAFVGVHVHGI